MTKLPKIIGSNIQAKNAHDMPAFLAIEINPVDTYGLHHKDERSSNKV
jgi:hypothetical protein